MHGANTAVRQPCPPHLGDSHDVQISPINLRILPARIPSSVLYLCTVLTRVADFTDTLGCSATLRRAIMMVPKNSGQDSTPSMALGYVVLVTLIPLVAFRAAGPVRINILQLCSFLSTDIDTGLG